MLQTLASTNMVNNTSTHARLMQPRTPLTLILASGSTQQTVATPSGTSLVVTFTALYLLARRSRVSCSNVVLVKKVFRVQIKHHHQGSQPCTCTVLTSLY